MQIRINTVRHEEQPYKTSSSWYTPKKGNITVYVSETGNDDYNILLGLHELVKAILCEKRGITAEQVAAFDKNFEKLREGYPEILGKDEPGDHRNAPYVAEYRVASGVEGIVARELGIDLQAYDEALVELQ